MNLSEKKVTEWEGILREHDLLHGDDHIIEHVMADYWHIGKKSGQIFFTNESIVFLESWLISTLEIRYCDIKDVKPCMIGLISPTGLTVSAIDTTNNKIYNYKFNLMKRKKWIEYIAQKAGLSI